jgi:hypothetical protein
MKQVPSRLKIGKQCSASLEKKHVDNAEASKLISSMQKSVDQERTLRY